MKVIYTEEQELGVPTNCPECYSPMRFLRLPANHKRIMNRSCPACGRTWKIRLRKHLPGIRYVDYMRGEGNVEEMPVGIARFLDLDKEGDDNGKKEKDQEKGEEEEG